jgi:cytochrome c oxidase assembly protein subunit 15
MAHEPVGSAPPRSLAAPGLRRLASRVLPRSDRGFAQLVTALVALMWLNIASGAFVRLTSSGLGCPNWPGCGEHPYPPASHHALIEFSNRLVAFSAICVALLTVVAAYRLRRPLTDRRLALAVAGLVLFQAPLGAITVHFDLNPLLVMSHFLVAILATAAAVVLWARTWAPAPASGQRPRWAVPLALGTGVLAAALFVSGALSTAAGPHSGGVDIRRYGNWWTATHWHVVAATAFTVTLTVLLLRVWSSSFRPSRLGELTLALVLLLPLQAFLGEYQRLNGLPWGVVLAHVSVAASVWICVFALCARVVGQPEPEKARGPVEPGPADELVLSSR